MKKAATCGYKPVTAAASAAATPLKWAAGSLRARSWAVVPS